MKCNKLLWWSKILEIDKKSDERSERDDDDVFKSDADNDNDELNKKFKFNSWRLNKTDIDMILR